MVDLKLYPGEHHSLCVQNGVLTLSADVQAVWDCIEAAGLEGDLIEGRINASQQDRRTREGVGTNPPNAGARDTGENPWLLTAN